MNPVKKALSDLLERRENARVSMNLDSQRGGLNFRIQEPADRAQRLDAEAVASHRVRPDEDALIVHRQRRDVLVEARGLSFPEQVLLHV